jgi:hypothetical protein
MSEYAKTMVGIGIVIASGFLGSLAAAPVFDLAARSICSTFAADEGFMLIDAQGGPHSVPAYRCRFKDPTGTTVIVDEDDHLVELTYRHRGYGLGGFFVWGFVILVGFRLSQSIGLFRAGWRGV